MCCWVSHGRVVCLSCWLCRPWNHLQLFSYKGSPNLPHWGAPPVCVSLSEMSANVSVRRVFTLISLLAVCGWIPGCQLRIWSGWVPVPALPERRDVHRPRQSFQVLLPTRNSGYEAQQLSECYKREFSSLTTGFMRHGLKGTHYVLWRMFPKYTESLEIHIFSLKINAAFFPPF